MPLSVLPRLIGVLPINFFVCGRKITVVVKPYIAGNISDGLFRLHEELPRRFHPQLQQVFRKFLPGLLFKTSAEIILIQVDRFRNLRKGKVSAEIPPAYTRVHH